MHRHAARKRFVGRDPGMQRQCFKALSFSHSFLEIEKIVQDSFTSGYVYGFSNG